MWSVLVWFMMVVIGGVRCGCGGRCDLCSFSVMAVFVGISECGGVKMVYVSSVLSVFRGYCSLFKNRASKYKIKLTIKINK